MNDADQLQQLQLACRPGFAHNCPKVSTRTENTGKLILQICFKDSHDVFQACAKAAIATCHSALAFINMNGMLIALT